MSVEVLIDKLRGDGARITKGRQAILEVLLTTSKPVSINDIEENLKKRKASVNRTTVYREIAFLLEKRLIREVDLLDGSKRFERISEGDHHHHLICTECRSVQCVSIPGDLHEVEQKLSKKWDFDIQHHQLEFFGLCRGCK